MTSGGVNALNGLSSFLRWQLLGYYFLVIMCQRPERAFFISTYHLKTGGDINYVKWCQRPERAFFISTYIIQVADNRILGVNALNGLSSFLQFMVEAWGPMPNMCQRPERAFFISTYDKNYD